MLPNIREISKPSIIHTNCVPLIKCCWCIHLRVGACLTSLIWAALSMYFAITSFQGNMPFYSYLDSSAVRMFGVVNLFMAFGGIAGVVATYLRLSGVGLTRVTELYLFIVGFAVMVDSLVNVIVFGVREQDYITACVPSALSNSTDLLNHAADAYNCQRTWEAELKFGILATLAMIIFYTYWLLCFKSYRHKVAMLLREEQRQLSGMPPMSQQGPPMSQMGQVPPSFNIPPAHSHQQPPSNIIVLNNVKPSKTKNKQNRRLSTFTSTPTPPPPPPPYSFDFKIGIHGDVLDRTDSSASLGDKKMIPRKMPDDMV